MFYSEESFDYDAVLTPRDRDSRKNSTPMLGYYGGAVLEGGGVTALPLPQITVTNNEILSISMYTSNPFAGTVTDGTFFGGLRYVVTVRSLADPSKSHTFSTDDIQSRFAVSLYTYTLGLDSLTAAEQFRDICPEITPGENVSVTVTVSYDGPGGTALPATASKTTNSLFASRAGNAVNVAYGQAYCRIWSQPFRACPPSPRRVQTTPIDWEAPIPPSLSPSPTAS